MIFLLLILLHLHSKAYLAWSLASRASTTARVYVPIDDAEKVRTRLPVRERGLPTEVSETAETDLSRASAGTSFGGDADGGDVDGVDMLLPLVSVCAAAGEVGWK